MIKYEELEIGGYYVCDYGTITSYIIKIHTIDKEFRECLSYMLHNNNYNTNGSFRFNNGSTLVKNSKCICLRKANYHEIKHLDLCIKNMKYMEYNYINQEIFIEIY